jgi:hypothetical protein
MAFRHGMVATALRVALIVTSLLGASCYRDSVNVTVAAKSRINRLLPLFGLDVGGTVRGEATIASAGWPPTPPPEGVNVYLAFFSVQQWCCPAFGSFAHRPLESRPGASCSRTLPVQP